jgi:hypothetical protein
MTEKFTVGDLKRELSGMSDDTEISFSGNLTFYRSNAGVTMSLCWSLTRSKQIQTTVSAADIPTFK